MRRLRLLLPPLALVASAASSGAFGGACSNEPVQAVIVTVRVAPSSLDFGSVPVGALAHRVVAVASTGNGPFQPSQLPEIKGAGPFAIASPCAFPVAPGGFCNIDVAFQPVVEGAATGTLVVHGPDADIAVALTAVATAAQIVVDPPQIDFGAVDVGLSAQHSFTVENRGSADVAAHLVITGAGFFTGGGVGQDLALAAGAVVTVPVDFSPTQGGAAAGQAVVEICGAGCGPFVALSGSGIAPRIDVEPRVVDFGDNVAVGDAPSVDLTVKNTGAGNLVVSAVEMLAETAELTVTVTAPPAAALPLVLAEGETATVTVVYAPVGARGSLDATLRIASNDPVSPAVLIPVNGASQGPAFEILPRVVNLGAIDEGEHKSVDVVIRSIGTVPVDVTGVDLQGSPSFAFVTAAPQPQTLAPGESILFSLAATAHTADVAAGGAEATLVASAAGLADQTLALAFLSGTTGCQPRAPAPNAALGSVALAQGSTGQVLIENVGDAPCTLTSDAPAPGLPFDHGFTYSVAAAQTLPAGGSAPVQFAFHCSNTGQQSAFVELAYGGATLLVSSTARGVDGELVGVPALLEMGPVIQGCHADTRTATFENRGGDVVVVSSIALDPPSAPFSLALPAFPTSLPPGAAFAVAVTPLSVGPGTYAANIVATTEANDASVRLTLDVQSQGQTVTEDFTAGDVSAVDVLFVIDNSGSMADDQQQLADNFHTFIDTAFTQDTSVSFHLGITTTDVIGNTGGPLIAPFLTRNTGNLETVFATQAVVGTDGNGTELGLEAMRRALDDDANTGNNAGFLRTDAALSVIIVSDEEDNGGFDLGDPSLARPVETYTEFLGGLKGGTIGNTPVLVSVVVTPQVAFRYETVASAFGGVALDIQSATWGQQLSQIGAATFGLQRLFRLGSEPDPATVVVTVNGVPLAAGDFTVIGKQVILTDDPAANALVEVTYSPGCAP